MLRRKWPGIAKGIRLLLYTWFFIYTAALARCTKHVAGVWIGYRCLKPLFSKCIFPIRHLPIEDTNLDLLTKNWNFTPPQSAKLATLHLKNLFNSKKIANIAVSLKHKALKRLSTRLQCLSTSYSYSSKNLDIHIIPFVEKTINKCFSCEI